MFSVFFERLYMLGFTVLSAVLLLAYLHLKATGDVSDKLEYSHLGMYIEGHRQT